jgi:outer membrane protein OmpA-like peptidoglycan-associated protein/opacity protein-like surface antigen
MRRFTVIALLLLATVSVSGQRSRGFALGADRDTLQYIIASPFDNWYLALSGGIQTFIGNELVASARMNKLNFNAKIEIGKWVIPDIAVSLRLYFFNVDGQTQYGRQPFVDYSTDARNDNGYTPFHAHAAAILGFVTLDWTNFVMGYESGKRNRWHVFTPIGLGMSMLYGIQRNPVGSYEVGSFRRNMELAFSLGVGVEYIISDHVTIHSHLDLFGSESTWDWTPYKNDYSIFDLNPSLNIGVKFNLLKSITKFNPYTKTSAREKVNHEFLSFGTRNTVSTLQGRIDHLNNAIDSVQNLSHVKGERDSLMLVDMSKERDSLQQRLDSVEDFLGRAPVNVIEELLQSNESLGLPATIVYYQLDKYDVDYNGRKKLQKFAKEVNNLDDTIEYYVIGAADSITGSIRHNQWLSERRCEAAYNILVNDFNVSSNQLLLMPVGGIMEYDPQENNRMALIIQRTPQTEAIVNKWMEKYRNVR